MIGVKYNHAVRMIWYISTTSGKKIPIAERSRPIPSENAKSSNSEIGKVSTVQGRLFSVTRIMANSGTKENNQFTAPVNMEEIAKVERGMYMR